MTMPSDLTRVKVSVCPKCGNAMGEAKRYHAIPSLDVTETVPPKVDLNRVFPIHIYACEKCHYLEIYGAGKAE
jgi:predicted nucleic-acid-binding Zn-ribbon protein